MRKLTWWFRVVGAFYGLLGLMNIYFMFIDTGIIKGTLPFEANALTVQAFIDGWSPFAFEIIGIATFLLWASRRPLKYAAVVWLIAWLEIWHGVVDDLYLILRGYDAASYIVFIVVHLLIAGTGVVFLRQATAAGEMQPETSGAALKMG